MLLPFPIISFNAAVAISPDWQELAISDGNALKVYCLEDGQLLVTLQDPSGHESSLAFSSEGSLLASMGLQLGNETRTGSVELWRISDGRLLNSWGVGVGALAFSPDGKLLVTWYSMTGIRDGLSPFYRITTRCWST